MQYKYNQGSSHAALQLLIIEWLKEHVPEDAKMFDALRRTDGGRMTIDKVAMRMATAAIEVGEIASEAATLVPNVELTGAEPRFSAERPR